MCRLGADPETGQLVTKQAAPPLSGWFRREIVFFATGIEHTDFATSH